MSQNLSDQELNALRKYEKLLQKACSNGNLSKAKEFITELQKSFLENRGHFRIQRAKRWYYEALLDAGKTEKAKQGLESITKNVGKSSRGYVEAIALLSVCYLRLKKFDSAKSFIQIVITHTNNIQSPDRRQQFEERYIQRIEDEIILSQLVTEQPFELNQTQIEHKVVELANKQEAEILEIIGGTLPKPTQMLLTDVVANTVKLLPAEDQKALPAPEPEIPNDKLGEKGLAMVKRIGWRTFCDSDSAIYKTWNSNLPEFFAGGTFVHATLSFFQEWKIDAPVLAAGFMATAMKYTCMEFCEKFKPEGLMIPQNEKR